TDLKDLEDAQDELLDANAKREYVEAHTDTADKPPPKPPQTGDLSLDGPERDIPKPPTSVYGPDAATDKPAFATTLESPAIKHTPKPESSLYGKDVKQPEVKSTLFDGAQVEARVDAPTTVGDAKDIAKAQKDIAEPQKLKARTWWQRITGGKSEDA